MTSESELSAQAWDKENLLELLNLHPVSPDLFRSRVNEKNLYSIVFGGQLVAQALCAADATVTDRSVHSLHGYFVNAGSSERCIDYHVERVRDGGRLSARQVTAIQDGKTLFTMGCSYRVPMQGFEHQMPLPNNFDPDNAMDIADMVLTGHEYLAPFMDKMLAFPRPVEIRVPGPDGYLTTRQTAHRHYWLRVPSAAASDDPIVHAEILTYISDVLLSGAALVPHITALPGPHLFVTSLDHSIWFHRPVRCDDWLFFDTDSPSAQGGVNLSQGRVFNRAGELVATVAQEALQLATGLPGAK